MLVFAIIMVVIALFALLIGFTDVLPARRVVRRRPVIIEREVPVGRDPGATRTVERVVERRVVE